MPVLLLPLLILARFYPLHLVVPLQMLQLQRLQLQRLQQLAELLLRGSLRSHMLKTC
jgi:hypothetical protein